MASPNLQTLRIINVAIMLTPLVLFAVLQVMPLAPSGDQQVVMILKLLALAQIPMILVLRKVVMGGVALGGADVPPGASQADEAVLDDAIRQARSKYFTGTIVGSAVAESIALFGFVAGFISGDAGAALPFLAGGMVLIAVQHPREQSMLSLVDAPLRALAQRRLDDKQF